MRRAGRLLIALGLLLLWVTSAAFAQELYLNNTVVVAGDGETLGSIGVVTGGGARDELAALLSEPLPALSDHPSLVPARNLRNKLPKNLDTNMVFVGGPILYLPAGVNSQEERTFYTALLQTIEKALPDRSLQVEVWAKGGLKPNLSETNGLLTFRFPSGDGSVQALLSNSFVQYKGANDPTFSYLPIDMRIEALVPVAKQDISFGTKFASSELAYKAMDVSSLTGTPADPPGGMIEARADITRGQVVYSQMVGKVQAITAGKPIRIAFRKGSVEVSVPGSAYESGALGDTISVGSLSNGRRYSGTVVSPTEVIVEN